DDRIEHSIEVLRERLLSEVHKVNARVHAFDVEERKLLLIAEHLNGWFAQHGEVDGGTLRGRKCEHDLVGEGCFPRPGVAGEQDEREFGEATAKHFIETWNVGNQLPYLGATGSCGACHDDASCPDCSNATGAPGHTSRIARRASSSPMKVIRRAMTLPSMPVAAAKPSVWSVSASARGRPSRPRLGPPSATSTGKSAWAR